MIITLTKLREAGIGTRVMIKNDNDVFSIVEIDKSFIRLHDGVGSVKINNDNISIVSKIIYSGSK